MYQLKVTLFLLGERPFSRNFSTSAGEVCVLRAGGERGSLQFDAGWVVLSLDPWHWCPEAWAAP